MKEYTLTNEKKCTTCSTNTWEVVEFQMPDGREFVSLSCRECTIAGGLETKGAVIGYTINDAVEGWNEHTY